METQLVISRRRLAAKVGRRLEVLVDRKDDAVAVGRSHADAPEIDGLVYVRDGAQLRPGDIVSVEVEASDDYDLHARLCNAGDNRGRNTRSPRQERRLPSTR